VGDGGGGGENHLKGRPWLSKRKGKEGTQGGKVELKDRSKKEKNSFGTNEWSEENKIGLIMNWNPERLMAIKPVGGEGVTRGKD